MLVDAQPGYLGYFEIDEIRQTLRAQNLEEQAVQFVPGDGYYMVFDDQWVGYVRSSPFTPHTRSHRVL